MYCYQHGKHERVYHDGKSVKMSTSIKVDPVFSGVKGMSELVNPVRNKHNNLYLGSIDIVTARIWAKECGAKLYSKEWNTYAKKKLMSGDYSKFRADRDKVVYNGANLSRL